MPMTLSDIQRSLRAKIIVGDDKLNIQVMAGAASDLMSDLLMGPAKTGVVVFSGLCNIQVIRTAVLSGVAALVLVRGKEPDQDMVSHARKHGLPLMSTPFTMFTACGRIFKEGLKGVEHKVTE